MPNKIPIKSLINGPVIMWSALPNGTKDNLAYLSVFVSPRLYWKNETTLKDFPCFLDWPGVLRDLVFSINFPAGSGKSFIVKPFIDKDASKYWKGLFPRETLVEPYQFKDYSSREFKTYPVRSAIGSIRDIYKLTANASPISLIPIRRKEDSFKFVYDDPLMILREMDGDYFPSFPEVQDFFDCELKDKPIDPPIFDFHQLISALGDHPAALRKLGLIIDFELPMNSITSKNGKLRIGLKWSGMGNKWNTPGTYTQPRNVTPYTNYILTDKDFRAQSKSGSEIIEGYLDLQHVSDIQTSYRTKYDLVQFDMDGAAIKLKNLSCTIANIYENSVHDYVNQPNEIGLPALRSAGISLVRAGRKEGLMDRLRRNKELNAALEKIAVSSSSSEGGECDIEFYWDDLLRGYRLDILDSLDTGSSWRSLCRRAGNIIFPNAGLATMNLNDTDEGFIKSTSSTSTCKKSDQERLHEAVMQWNGWSLVVKLPGLAAQSASERLDHYANAKHVNEENDSVPTFPFEAHYSVPPKSLPILRFGRKYRLRARAVDLAGNGLQYGSQVSRYASDELIFQRYEPLSPPVIVPRYLFIEGESLERMVIRSYTNTDAARNFEDDAKEASLPPMVVDSPSERHIVPPKTSIDMAEKSGALDKWLKTGDFESAFRVASKEKGVLKDVQEEQKLQLPYLPDPGVLGAVFWYGKNLSEIPRPGEWHWPENLNEIAAKLPPDMVKNTGDIFTARVRYSEKNGVNPTWPDYSPFRLVLKKAKEIGQGMIQWDASCRELSIFLKKAQVLDLRCSSLLNPSILSYLGVWKWLKELTDNPFINDMNALLGLLWMLTPYRTLTLVHAVDKPLQAPGFSMLINIRKQVNETSVIIKSGMDLNVASTGKIELMANWEDPWDDPLNGSPVDVEGKLKTRQHNQFVDETIISSVNLKYDLSACHQIGDTNHHWVYYSMRATTRFREYFPPNPNTSDAPEEKEKKLRYEVDNHTITGKPVRVDIPNSTRPPAPKVAYVIPTFAWTQSEILNGFVRTRLGGGLRIYLERPWFASGPDEQIAVVLLRPGEIMEDSAGKLLKIGHLVTLFGKDPVWASGGSNYSLTANDFLVPEKDGKTSAPEYDYDCHLIESPSAKVDIAAFDVKYGKEQDRWYADIQLDMRKIKAYYPFIRLALARYQSHSVPTPATSLKDDAKISSVVLTEFIQIVPTRILTFTRQPKPGNSLISIITVKLEGYKPVGENSAIQHTEIELIAEINDLDNQAGEEPLGWKKKEITIFPRLGPQPGEPGYDPEYFIWSANLEVSKVQLRGNRMRLVIKEYEAFPKDSDAPGNDGRRVVYADTIAIN